MQCYPRWPRPPRGPQQISAQGSFPPNLRACLCQTVTADRSELRLQSSRCFLSVRAIGHNKQDGGCEHRFHFEPMKRLLQIAQTKIVTVAMGCITASCCSDLQNKMHRWMNTEGGGFLLSDRHLHWRLFVEDFLLSVWYHCVQFSGRHSSQNSFLRAKHY